MKDWKAAAAALAPDVPGDAVDRIVQPLSLLETQFRPLVARIPLGTEPAYALLPTMEPVE